MSDSLLEISSLTLRFGGLTAVQDVDLRVQSGEIFAVIGPNGAGKTSLFNIISGIYAPTQGQIHFCRQPLTRPLTRLQVLWWLVTGFTVGLVLMLFAANVDRMWAVVVKQNFVFGQSFNSTAAWHDAVDYMRAAPHIEQRMGRYHVVSYDGQTAFGTTRNRDEAKQILASVYDQALADGGSARRSRTLVLLVGFVAGTLAAFTVWRQSRRTTSWIARQGIARTFQNNRLFANLSVVDNVMVALDRHNQASMVGAIAQPAALAGLLILTALGARAGWSPWVSGAFLVGAVLGAIAYMLRLLRLKAFSSAQRDGQEELWSQAVALLRFVGLQDQAQRTAANLAYGDQRRLEIARALATRPKLILLDEPAAGMNPTETRALMQLIRAIRDKGIAVMLIEHDMKLVMEISDRIAVLEYGRKIADAEPAAVRADPRVVAAYLGTTEGA